jgi:hypothetical protein
MSSSDPVPGSGYPVRTGSDGPEATTAILPPVRADRAVPVRDVGDRLAGAADVARDRVARLDGNARLAWAGAIVTALGFLLLPYARNGDTAVELGGRLWWRPILAVTAAVLLTTATRGRWLSTTLVAAVAIAAAAVTEAGLFGLVSSGTAGARVGFFGMLLGCALVIVAAVRAAARRIGPGAPAQAAPRVIDLTD